MKKVLFILTITASLFIIKDLVYSIYSLWSKKDLLTVAQKELGREKQENNRLVVSLSEAKKQSFIEEEARNKLFLAKPGESIVVLPHTSFEAKIVKKEAPKPNWQQWLQLFF